MKYVLLVVFMVCSFVAPVLGSEKVDSVDDKIVLTVKLKDALPSLVYLSQKDIKKLEKFFSEMSYNEPVFAVTGYESKTEHAKCIIHGGCILDKDKVRTICNDLQTNVLHLPLKYFLLEKNKFKSRGAELCSYRREDRFLEWGPDYPDMSICHTYDAVINFDSDVANGCLPENCIQKFRESPNYDQQNKQKLIDAGILAEENGEIVHGPNSYFAEEIKSALFYSQLKKFVFGGVIAVIIMYVLYKKFYSTAG